MPKMIRLLPGVYHGDCRKVLRESAEETFTACVTDPPYEIHFMNKKWDKRGVSFHPETWREVWRALKPGGFLLAFGGTRTFHRIAVAIEDAGFEIRDCVMWLHSQGFPKSHDVSKGIDREAGAEREVTGRAKGASTSNTNSLGKFSSGYDSTVPATEAAKQWEGFGTALKPSFEPIVVAMKPMPGTFARNAVKQRVAGLNIDASRIQTAETWKGRKLPKAEDGVTWGGDLNKQSSSSHDKGRFPSNVILDGSDEVLKLFRGNTSRFFYTAKASKEERGSSSKHPTVKPISLMKYLIGLVTYPEANLILDPFCGSGSTLMACADLGVPSVGIDRDEEAVAYCLKRFAERA